MDVPVRFIDSIINNPLLMQFLVHRWFFLLEYDPRLDQLRVYDTRSRTLETLDAYLGSEKPEHATIFAEDRWKMRALLTGELFGPLEMRFVSPEGVYYSREVDARPVEDPARGTLYVGYAKDITDQKNQTQELLEQARHDSLTQLYNNRTGKELIDRYLQAKDPYASCGMLVIDLDFFKNVNDRYGHLFGDKVLQEFARMLRTLFRSSDILVRFGGDEFVVFLKDIPNTTLLQKTRQLSESVQQVKFWENDYRMTCSIGACFLTLFHSYDEYGTTVLQADNMGMYSPQGRALLMQGGAQTVVYAAMYGEGEYQGAIAYVVCGSKRYWTPQNRRELGEITKIINAYLSKHLAVNAVSRGMTSAPEFDRLTGLLAFSRFKEEVSHKIIGGYAEGYQIFYCDFENFKYFNEKYSYATGDQLLKEFSNFLIEAARHWGECFLCRVVGDQFVLYLSCRDEKGPLHYADTLCRRFEQYQAQHYPEVRLRVRMGVYAIEPGCLSASAAIDKANFARKQVRSNTRVSAIQFDKKLEVKQTLTGELLSGLPQALENGEFKLYLQPKFSPKDLSVIGAEALTRWIKPDGTVVYPDQFIPILESTGRIVELDLYIFEQVAQFLQRNAQAGHRLLPIAVNASAVLAREDAPTQEYSEILEKHNISARMLEIELTETAVVSEYDRVKRLLSSFQSDGMQTSLDDFGAGSSLLNNMVDIPVNTIKLDKLFLTRCSSNARGTDFLREVVHLVKRLGYNVICEGIETEEQVQLLRSLDCDGAQGFWFSKAIPAEEFERRYLCD